MHDMPTAHLALLCDLTYKLVQLRQNECKHLAVENAAPEILRKLIEAYYATYE